MNPTPRRIPPPGHHRASRRGPQRGAEAWAFPRGVRRSSLSILGGEYRLVFIDWKPGNGVGVKLVIDILPGY